MSKSMTANRNIDSYISNVYILFSGWHDRHKRRCARASSHVGKQTEQTIGRVCSLGYGWWCESGQSVISILRYLWDERVICICTKITMRHSILPDAHANENRHLWWANSIACCHSLAEARLNVIETFHANINVNFVTL